MKVKRKSCFVVVSILTILCIVLSTSVFADDVPTIKDAPVSARLVNSETHEVIVIDEKDIGKKIRYVQPKFSIMDAFGPQDDTSMQVEYDVALKFDPNDPNAAPSIMSTGESHTTAGWDESYSVRAYATVDYTISVIGGYYCIRVDGGSVRWEKSEASIRVLNKSILIGELGKDIDTRQTISNTIERPVSGMSAGYRTNFSNFIIADDTVFTASTWAICDIQRGSSNTWHLEVQGAARL